MLGFRELAREELDFVSGGDDGWSVMGPRATPLFISGAYSFFGACPWDSNTNDQCGGYYSADDWNPDADDDGDGILNKDEDIVVNGIKPLVTDIGDGKVARLYPDGVAEVFQSEASVLGLIHYGIYIGNYKYSVTPQDGEWSFSLPFGISYTPGGDKYTLAPIAPTDPDSRSAENKLK